MEIFINTIITALAMVAFYLSNRRLSLPSFGQLFAFFYIFFIIVGSYILYFEDPVKYSKTLLLANAGFLAFSAGGFFSSAFNMLCADDYARFRARPLVDRYGGVPFVLTVLVLLSMALVLCALFFRNGIPLLSFNVDQARYAASTGGGYFFIGIYIFLPFVTLLLMAKTYMPENRAYKPFFYLVLAMTVFINILSGFRAPLASLLLMMLLLNFYIKGRFTWKAICIGLFVFSIVFFGITYIKLKDEPMVLSLVGEIFMRRVVLENPTVLAMLFDIFPARVDFMIGNTYLMDMVSAMPGPGISFGGWLFSQTPSTELYGVAGLTPTLVGELYANFSTPGAAVVMFIFGYSLNSLYIRFLRSGRDLSCIAIWMIFAFALANTVMVGFGNFLFTRFIEFAALTLVFFFLHHVLSSAASRGPLPGSGHGQRSAKTL